VSADHERVETVFFCSITQQTHKNVFVITNLGTNGNAVSESTDHGTVETETPGSVVHEIEHVAQVRERRLNIWSAGIWRMWTRLIVLTCPFSDAALCDVILKTADGVGDEMYVHRCVIASNSEYFEQMFVGAEENGRKSVVRVDGVGNDALRHLIDFIYTGELVTIDAGNVEVVVISQIDYRFTPRVPFAKKKCFLRYFCLFLII